MASLNGHFMFLTMTPIQISVWTAGMYLINFENIDILMHLLCTRQCIWRHESQSVSWSVVSDSLPPHELEPSRLICPWNSPGKNTGVSSHFLLQGIFPTQWWNPGLLHGRQILYHLSHQESPNFTLKFLKGSERCQSRFDAWYWMLGARALGRTTQRDGMGREEGGGFRMGNTCIPVADSFWYLAKLIQLCKV